MSFQYVAINDGCMARLELNRDAVSGFDLRDVTNVLRGHAKACVFKVFAPAAAASSARGFVYFYQRLLSLLFCQRR
jgi:hypothetical protein